MSGVSRSDILALLERSVEGSGLIGGRRRVRRPRRRHVRGRGEEVESLMSEMMYGDGVIGSGLIGGARKRRSGHMSEATKRYLAAYHKLHPRRKRRVRGRGPTLNQQEYEDMYSELLYKHPELNEAGVRALLNKMIGDTQVTNLLKLGVNPFVKTKSAVIKSINQLEKKLGMHPSSRERLNEYTVAALRNVLKALNASASAFRYPPIGANNARLNPSYDDEDYFPNIGSSAARSKINKSFSDILSEEFKEGPESVLPPREG